MITLGLIGSPNAGKSTLFNRLIGSYRAIVTDIPGTTRDILRQEAFLEDIGNIEVLDSPGLDKQEDELPYIQSIIDESHSIILVIDGKAGFTANDRTMINMVRKAGKIQHLVVFINKIDQAIDEHQEALLYGEFSALGVKHISIGSAQHGNTTQLLDTLEELAQDVAISSSSDTTNTDSPDDQSPELMLDSLTTYLRGNKIPIALVGRPNVGKSTLINTISQKNLSKVSDIPGTTLDYLSYDFTQGDQSFVLYDTAGMRRPGRTSGLERIAKDKTFGMLKYLNPVVLFLMDGTEGVTKTDRNALENITDLGLPTLLLINKIDLLSTKQKEHLLKAVEEFFGEKDRNFTLGISAKTGYNIDKIWSKAQDLRTRAHQQLSTGQLNKIIKQGLLANPPSFPHNKIVKVYYATQVKTYPPSFMIFINNKSYLTQAFKNRLETQIRLGGGYQGISLKLLFKDKQMDEEGYQAHLKKRGKAIRARAKKHPDKLKKRT